MYAWRKAGFRTLEQFIWVKEYPSSVGAVERYHEAAYLLAKGNPPKPNAILPSVMKWQYTGNTQHPTQKPVASIIPLVLAYSSKGDTVLDPFFGSGSILCAANMSDREYIGIELVEQYAITARRRTEGELEARMANLKPEIPVASSTTQK